MPTSIPYDPSLVLGNLVNPVTMDRLNQIATLQAPIDAAQDTMNSFITMKRSIDMTIEELQNMGIDTADVAKQSVVVGTNITKSAIAYAQTRITQELAMQPLRGKAVAVHESIESPIDYNRTMMKPLALSSRSTFSWRNRFLTGHAMSIGLTFVAYHMSGWRGVGVFIVTALLSKSVLELINYIQHYGLVRLEGTPIAMHHCWNSNKRVSTYLLCNATRHSSHHIDPYQPFWLLKPMPEAPTLPLGYFSSMFVALVPPVWHRLMASRLLNWDDHFASPEERHVAALHNERSGVRRLLARQAIPDGPSA